MINQNQNMQNAASGNQPYAIPNDVYHNSVTAIDFNYPNDAAQTMRKIIKYKRSASQPQGPLRSASGSKTRLTNFQPGTYAQPIGSLLRN